MPKPSVPPQQQQQQTMSYEAAKKEVKFDVSIPKGNEPRFFDEPPVQMEVRSPASEAPLGNAAEDAFAENQRFLREQAVKAKQERVEPDTLTYKGELFRTYNVTREKCPGRGYLRYAFRWEASRSICRWTHRLTIVGAGRFVQASG